MIDPILFGHEDQSVETARANARRRAARETAAHRTRRETSHLEDRLERLSLVCMAMWSLLQDKTGLTEEDLLERVRTLDLIDGVADGKATRTVARCVQCQRVMSPRHRKCLYCGASKLVQSAFDAL